MSVYFNNSKDAAQYVTDMLPALPKGLQWTMTITPDWSEGYYVSPVTAE